MEIVRSRDTSYIVDGFLVVYDIYIPEHSRLRVLAEVMVCRLERGGRFSSVTSFLCRKAQEANCVMVGVGTSLSFSDEGLASLYEREGFQREALQLCKVI